MKKLKQTQNKQLTTLSISEIIFPEKYEKIFFIFYVLLLPFLVGHIFLFTYISNFNYEVYSTVCNDNNSFLTWCMGYESFAIIFFILLFINSLSKYTPRKS